MLSGNDNINYDNLNYSGKIYPYFDEQDYQYTPDCIMNQASISHYEKDRTIFDQVLKAAQSYPIQDKTMIKKPLKQKGLQRSRFYHDGMEHEFKRPLLSYNELIIESLNNSETGMLSLQQIYDYIQTNYLFFKHSNVAWQNSIRHNLSVQKIFQRVPRPIQNPGKGGLWRLLPLNDVPSTKNSLRTKKRKSQQIAIVNSPIQNQRFLEAQSMKRHHLMDTLATLALSVQSQELNLQQIDNSNEDWRERRLPALGEWSDASSIKKVNQSLNETQFDWKVKDSVQKEWPKPLVPYLHSPFMYRTTAPAREPNTIEGKNGILLDPVVGDKTLMQATNVESPAEVSTALFL